MATARALVAGFVVAVLAVVGFALFAWGPLVVSTNGVPAGAYAVGLPPGARLCQPAAVPPAAASVELLAQTYGRPGPALLAEVDVAGRRLARGHVGGGYADGWLSVPLDLDVQRQRGVPGATMCVRNRGGSPVAMAGAPAGPSAVAVVDESGTRVAVSMRWRRADEPWPAKAATVLRRATRGKADLGPWAPLVLLGAVWAGALALVLTRRAA
jgi:hypothetical protein